MRIFLNRWFARFARRERIGHDGLVEAIARASRGLVDADLGGGLIKQRIARAGKGRSGGYRAIIAIRKGHKAFFIYGFAKNDQEDLDPAELAKYKQAAIDYLALTDVAIDMLCSEAKLLELERDAETPEE